MRPLLQTHWCRGLIGFGDSQGGNSMSETKAAPSCVRCFLSMGSIFSSYDILDQSEIVTGIDER